MSDNEFRDYVNNIDDALVYDLLPSVSKKALDYLYIIEDGITNKSKIVDIGSGTGRLAIDLLRRGSTVYAIEPDEKMKYICEKKCKKFKKFYSLSGVAEDIPLPDNSVDFVLSSQNFHSFDIKKFKSECHRILKKSQNIIIIWYRVNYAEPLLKDLLKALKTCFPKYKFRYENKNEEEGAMEEERDNNKSAFNFFDNNSQMLEFSDDYFLTKDHFLKLCLSLSLFPIEHELNSSTAIINNPNLFDKKTYKKLINDIYKKYQKNELIMLTLKTQVHLHNNKINLTKYN